MASLGVVIGQNSDLCSVCDYVWGGGEFGRTMAVAERRHSALQKGGRFLKK